MRRVKLPNGGWAGRPPYTKAEQQELMRKIGPPRMVAWPRGLRTAGSATAATNPETEATTAADAVPPEAPRKA
jgi:hypothetical protein